ncbi:MAG: winged helix-turn-helix domain-containing protein [Hyphomicrobiales bacterium]|nr:winged helix-turn-helix domain-containing protein [Hyphomicrobiales bacterium]
MGIREQENASADAIGTGQLKGCRLVLALLGRFSAMGSEGIAMTISAKKNRALLAVLALSPGMAATRERLAGLLWGDRPDEQARSSLRQSLAALRKELDDADEAILQVKDDTVRLCAATVGVDVAAFLKCGQSDDLESLREAARLYRSELLSDFGSRDEGFEAWLSIERAQLRQEAIRVLEKLAGLVGGGERLAVAQKLVSLDPLREASQRLLMHSQCCLGERGLALKQFDSLKSLLRDELGVEPAPETQHLANQIADGTIALSGSAAPPSVIASAKPVVAVLPFSNMSGDPEQDYFADGMTEDIITDLSRFSGISVIARNTVFAYKGKTPNVREVCHRLNACAVLEGSIRKSGQRVRITAQLTDGVSGTHLWADRYDRELTDIFTLQDEIARTIVEQLRIKLLPGELAAEHAPGVKFDAYNCYLKGRQFFHVGTRSSLKLARRLFECATKCESGPRYAKAFAGIALADARLRAWHGDDIPVAEILAAATAARELDPGLAEAQVAFGIAASQDGRSSEATAAFEKAIELDPDSYDAHFFYAWHSLANGGIAKSAELYRRATELQPDDFRSPIYLRSVFHALGDESEARRFSLLGLERAEKAFRLHPDSPDAAQLGACVLASLGECDKAKEWLSHSLAIDPDGMLSKYNSACVFAMLGESEAAVALLADWLKRADRHARRWFLIDADLVSLQQHPRYRELLEIAS